MDGVVLAGLSGDVPPQGVQFILLSKGERKQEGRNEENLNGMKKMMGVFLYRAESNSYLHGCKYE